MPINWGQTQEPQRAARSYKSRQKRPAKHYDLICLLTSGQRKLAAPPRERHNEGVNYGMGQSVCPQCGSGADVRTVAELFDMLSGAPGGATQQAYPRQQTGPDYPGTAPDNPGQGYQAPDSAGTNPDHPYESYQGPGFPTQSYQSQGPGPAPGYQGPDYPNSQGRRPTMDSGFGDDPAQDIANAVLGAAFKFAGRGIGKRMQKAYEERIGPALEARAAQARQQAQPSRDDQAAIVQRYPDLRGCLRDRVVFLEGGSRSVPITEIRMPLTLAQADAIVDRLRAP